MLSLFFLALAGAAPVPAAATGPAGDSFFVALPAELTSAGGALDVPAVVISNRPAVPIVVTAAVDGGAPAQVAKIDAGVLRRTKWATGGEIHFTVELGAGGHDVRICFAEKRKRAPAVCGQLTVAATPADGSVKAGRQPPRPEPLLVVGDRRRADFGAS